MGENLQKTGYRKQQLKRTKPGRCAAAGMKLGIKERLRTGREDVFQNFSHEVIRQPDCHRYLLFYVSLKINDTPKPKKMKFLLGLKPSISLFVTCWGSWSTDAKNLPGGKA